MSEDFRFSFQSLVTVKMSEYITDGGESIGAGEWNSVYVGGWRILVKLLCSVCQPEKLQCAETLLDDNISSDLQVQCVHTMKVGLQTVFILQLYTAGRLNSIQ